MQCSQRFNNVLCCTSVSVLLERHTYVSCFLILYHFCFLFFSCFGQNVTFTLTASWLAGVKRTILKLPRVFLLQKWWLYYNLALLTCFWYIICLLCKYNFVVLLCALQSALCSDQSHFSWFECYLKKDKVKNILIFFG